MNTRNYIFPGLAVIILGAFLLVTGVRENTDSKKTLEISSPVLPVLEAHSTGPDIDPYKHAEFAYAEYVIPEDYWYFGSSAEIRNAPIETLHHAIVFDKNSENYGHTCYPKIVTAKDKMITSLEGRYPEGYGLYLKRGTVLLLETMFYNQTGNTYSDVSYTIKLHVAPAADQGIKPIKLYHLILNDTSCGLTFSVPPGTVGYKRKSADGTLPPSQFVAQEDGDVVMLASHFHAYAEGRSLTAYLNRKKLYEFLPAKKAQHGHAHWIVPQIIGTPAVTRMRKGDILSYEVTYNNRGETPILDAMGELFVYFAPDSSSK